MFDYSQVSPRDFEYIAKEYLEDNYPGKWTLTSASNDGNRDVVCTFNFADQAYEYWAEAKFSKSCDPGKLQKGQLDPTLVSAMLYPKQVSLKFISNNNMPDSYIYRLTDFRIKTNIGVTVVLKEEFEKWLRTKPEICTQYKIITKNICSQKVHHLSENVELITGIVTEMTGTNMVVNKLTLGEPYFLYLIINSDKPRDNISIRFFPKCFNFLNFSTLYNNAERLSLISGKSGYKFCFTVNAIYTGEVEVALLENEQVLTKLKLPEVTISAPINDSIAYSLQSKVEAEIQTTIRNASKKNQIIGVLGEAASGKSYLIDNLFKDLSLIYETERFSFTGSSYYNCKQLCRLLVFLNIGNIDAYSCDAVKCALSSIRNLEMKMLLSEVYSHTKEAPEYFICKIFEKLVLGKMQLFFGQNSSMRRVVILEDVHKLADCEREVLHELLNQFLIAENNQVIIYTSRACNMPDIRHSYTAQLRGLSKNDKITTLKNYLGVLPESIQFDRYTDNLLVFSNIIRDLQDFQSSKSSDPISIKAQILKLCEHPHTDENEVLSAHLSKYAEFDDLIELVFYIESGIPYTQLSSYFSSTNIDYLIAHNIFKLSGGNVISFHDQYVVAYKKNHTLSANSVDILEKLLEIDAENSVQYLTILLDAGNLEFFKHLNRARSLRDYYFVRTMFYESYLLADAIVQQIDFNEQLSEEEVYDVYTLATSSFYEKSNKDVIELYKIVLEQGIRYSNSPKMWGIILRTRTELMNQYYWDLNIAQLNEAFDDAASVFPDITVNIENQVAFSCIHRHNRHMVFSLLMNRYEEAELDYSQCKQDSIRLNLPDSIGYAEMDYGKGLYLISLQDAIEHMKAASSIFQRSKTEYRRQLDCLCEIAYLNCLSDGCTPQNIHKLECAALTLYNAHFNELYAKAKLKLAALYLCLDAPDLPRAEEAIVEAEFVLPYHPCKRLQMLFANIKAVYYKLDGMHSYAVSEIKKHSMLAHELGNDYQIIAKHNSTVQFPRRAEFYTGNPLGLSSLLIDPRVW